MVTFDPANARSNLKKHGVRFSDCLAALDDPNGHKKEDWSKGEQRLITLGMSGSGSILVVTWTDRNRRVRIISARKASAGEAKHYGS
jgi:uncharacterized DUF497 family protein